MGFTDDAVPSTLFIDTYLVTRAEQKSIKPFRDCLAEEPFGDTALGAAFLGRGLYGVKFSISENGLKSRC